jgi:hypothetical protein
MRPTTSRASFPMESSTSSSTASWSSTRAFTRAERRAERSSTAETESVWGERSATAGGLNRPVIHRSRFARRAKRHRKRGGDAHLGPNSPTWADVCPVRRTSGGRTRASTDVWPARRTNGAPTRAISDVWLARRTGDPPKRASADDWFARRASGVPGWRDGRIEFRNRMSRADTGPSASSPGLVSSGSGPHPDGRRRPGRLGRGPDAAQRSNVAQPFGPQGRPADSR